MSQSSPEGIILSEGSKLISLKLSINKEEVLSIKQKEIGYNNHKFLNMLTFWMKYVRV